MRYGPRGRFVVASSELDSLPAEIPATASLTCFTSGWRGPPARSVVTAVREAFAMQAEAPVAPVVEP